jgi:hypothetical protein
VHPITLSKTNIEGLTALYAEGEILRLSGRRTNNNNLSSQRVTVTISRQADE